MSEVKNGALRLYEWIDQFLRPFVDTSIRIECIIANKYDPVYSEIIKEYKQFLKNDNTESWRKALDDANCDFKRVSNAYANDKE